MTYVFEVTESVFEIGLTIEGNFKYILSLYIKVNIDLILKVFLLYVIFDVESESKIRLPFAPKNQGHSRSSLIRVL